MNLIESLRVFAGDLEDLHVPWALVGGLAVSVWCEPRLTRDVDVAVFAAGDQEAERHVHDLRARGYLVAALVEHEAAGRLATARLKRDHDLGVVFDLLFASSGIEAEIVEEAMRIEIVPGLNIPVAPRSHLIVMKLLARDDRSRPQDADDLRALVSVSTSHDLVRARELLTLVEARGYNRHRDLGSAFNTLLSERRD